MSINIDFLERVYFYFDEPVSYLLQNKNIIYINPITLKQSEFFLQCADILNINKNESSSVEIIQMSYLDFLVFHKMKEEREKYKLGYLLNICLNLKNPRIQIDEKGKSYIVDGENSDTIITSKDFEDIRRIIMYQNILHYDDSYINPDLKKAIEETNELKNKNLVPPNVERKIAIITSHTGLSKEEQLRMTFRSHSVLFEEVVREVDYSTARSICLLGGKDMENWIFRDKKGKFEGYVMDADSYTKVISGNNSGLENVPVSSSGFPEIKV